VALQEADLTGDIRRLHDRPDRIEQAKIQGGKDWGRLVPGGIAQATQQYRA